MALLLLSYLLEFGSQLLLALSGGRVFVVRLGEVKFRAGGILADDERIVS